MKLQTFGRGADLKGEWRLRNKNGCKIWEGMST